VSCRSEAGFTYVALLIALAVFGIALAATGEVWRTAAKRERELDLLFAGSAYRSALASYYALTPAGQPRHPRTLEELIEDHRAPVLRRHLRRLYADPMSGKPDWGLVEAPGGGIAGVHSLSEEKPLKSGNFAAADAKFEGAASYADWRFVYVPPQVPGRVPPGRKAGR
jgi:type II secretory pathway pseudopilin PulG